MAEDQVEKDIANDEHVLTSYVHDSKTQPPPEHVLDNAGIDMGAIERHLTPRQAMQLQIRMKRGSAR